MLCVRETVVKFFGWFDLPLSDWGGKGELTRVMEGGGAGSNSARGGK